MVDSHAVTDGGSQLITSGARPASQDLALTLVFTDGELPLDERKHETHIRATVFLDLLLERHVPRSHRNTINQCGNFLRTTTRHSDSLTKELL